MSAALGYAWQKVLAFVVGRMRRDTHGCGAYGGFTAIVVDLACPAICWDLYCGESNGGDGRGRDCGADVLGGSRVGWSSGGSAPEGLVEAQVDEMMIWN